MKEMIENIEVPALGCKVGRAYQKMLSQLSQALQEEELDITASEYIVMRAVYSKPGLQQCEIAEMTGKDKAAICRCVSGLQKKGLVATEAVSYKCQKVYPTPEANDIEPKIMAVARKRHQELVSLVNVEELSIFNRILDKIIT